MSRILENKSDLLTIRYREKHGAFCACVPVSAGQKLYYAGILAVFLALLFYRWDIFLVVLSAVFMFHYAAAAFLRFGSALLSLGHHAEKVVPKNVLAARKDADLPVYTILVPLYHEQAVAEKILKRLGALDYPKDKLDVKLLLEADDSETRDALARAQVPSWCQLVDVPDGLPRTKPRACNYGLAAARGEFLVIYDAEDAPEPDQLRKAVEVFRADTGKHLICVQAKLNFYNADQNFLTKLFTIEYSTNFDMQLPGLQKFRLPLPLGGTSNHFRTKELAQLGGWDPYNVTEDCDLGIRIYENGYRTAVLESTTWEEANPNPGNWMRQRSRWVKGFFQTHLVHYRNPLTTLKRLGPWGFAGCYSFVGASVLMMLANLIFWPLILLYFFLLGHALASGEPLSDLLIGPYSSETLYHGIRLGPWRLAVWPLAYAGPEENPFLSELSQVLFLIGAFLFAMNFLLILVHALACAKRGFYRLIPLCIFMPLYWIMISAAAWKGVLQFLRKPFYWEKTRHGLDEPQLMAQGETSHA